MYGIHHQIQKIQGFYLVYWNLKSGKWLLYQVLTTVVYP